MNRHVRASTTILSILSTALAACASSPDEPARRRHDPVDALAARSAAADGIFVGEVVAIEPGVSQPDDQGIIIPVHFVTWRVDRGVRGIAGATWTGRFAGGTLPDGRTLTVSEVPEFAVGQRSLVLATHGDAGACPLVECGDGLLPIGELPHELAPARLDAALARLDAGKPGLARSADPRKPFVLDVSTGGADRVAP